MTRFADPLAVEAVDLGPCECPGAPHARDGAVVRWQLSGSELARVLDAQRRGQESGDPLLGMRTLVGIALVSWSLLDRDGEPAPCDAAHVEALDLATLDALSTVVDELVASRATLPNGSGARSAASSPASASPTPA